MKKIITGLSFLGLIGLTSSCSDYLNVDKYFKDTLTEQKVFESKDYSERWLAGVYSHLVGENADVASKGHTLNNFSDDMFFGDRDNAYVTFKNGLYDEGWKQTWGGLYVGIRDASTFINNIDINKELNAEEIADYKAQARFLRSYYYWLLLRKYGPVPLLPEAGMDYTESYENLSRPRNTYDECANFIVREMELAAHDLPLKRDNRNIARPTRGAALAARAKVLLYAASPLVNGNNDPFAVKLTDDKGQRLLSAVYDESKWARAAAAALDVMKMNVYYLYTAPFREHDISKAKPKTIIPPFDERYSDNNYPDGWKDIDPFESYRSLFNGDVQANANPELIFTRGVNQSGEGILELARHQVPYSAGGWNTHGVSLKQSDAYYMHDGSDIPGKDDYLGLGDGSKRVSGFVTQEDVEGKRYLPLQQGVSLQYANREPRFYASIAYNGSTWEMTSAEREDDRYRQFWYYRDFPDGKQASAPAFHIRTGLGVKKYYNPEDSFIKDTKSKTVAKAEPAIRYAEILLILAEAMNELEGSYQFASWNGEENYSISRDVNQIRSAILQIRLRAGLPDYPAGDYADKDLMRKNLKRERQIELFAEGHRYFDLRRWKDAETEEATPIYGCNMNMESQQKEQFYLPTVVPSLPTIFVEKMYFWPIAHDELRKNRKLTQNPGWTYFD
ncbi:MAG: RagB/SusD family nutrient uptake outer membrane protein [Bacteroidales bacterium]